MEIPNAYFKFVATVFLLFVLMKCYSFFQVEEIFRAMDHDHSGSITFTDFVAGCLVEQQVGEAALRTAFDRLDHCR